MLGELKSSANLLTLKAKVLQITLNERKILCFLISEENYTNNTKMVFSFKKNKHLILTTTLLFFI
jgi:hypothetical protein